MTSQPLSLDDDLLTLPKRLPVVIQVQEVAVGPSTGGLEETTLGVAELVGKTGNGPVDSSIAMLEGLGLKRPCSGSGRGGNNSSRPTTRRRSSSLGSLDGITMEHEAHLSRRRSPMNWSDIRTIDASSSLFVEVGLDHQRTAFHAVNHHQQASSVPATLSGPLTPFPLRFEPCQSRMPAQLNGPCGIIGPLTPPEEVDSFKWEIPVQTSPSRGLRSFSNLDPNRASARGQTHRQPRTSSAARPSEIEMPERSNVTQDESSRSNWLGRASQHLVAPLGDSGSQQQIQMVVQALPSQAKLAGVRPVYEKVVEDIQTHFTVPPYITITHAVSQVISMDEVPASPPATPNTTYSSDDYFQDQTIFTHAAVVPAYHSQAQVSAAAGPRPTNIIAAPSSIQVSILERYIPPTSAREVQDFFTLSRRSYLADRLLELSSNNGTLLLVYPTKEGASTFATRYIGPIIEPFLRQFILLNSLYTDVAIQLGKMAAVSGMKSFDEISGLLREMCEALGQRAPFRGLPSRYEIVHAETADVVLDRALWTEWFIEQEQPRLRQNLVDYHKAGGRMPSRSGQIEVTPGMLAREVVDGIRQSRQGAGNVGMEVAVFVIRRTMV